MWIRNALNILSFLVEYFFDTYILLIFLIVYLICKSFSTMSAKNYITSQQWSWRNFPHANVALYGTGVPHICASDTGNRLRNLLYGACSQPGNQKMQTKARQIAGVRHFWHVSKRKSRTGEAGGQEHQNLHLCCLRHHWWHHQRRSGSDF